MTAADRLGGTSAEAPWRRRFRAARISLPVWARDDPARCLYRSNEGGVTELHVWDRRIDARRQVTKRPFGTTSGALDPRGDRVWWFDDEHGNELGRWVVEPFDDGHERAVAASDDLPPGYEAGLALGATCAVVGLSNDEGVAVFVLSGPVPGLRATTLYRHVEDAHVGGLNRDETLVVIAHSEHGDSRNRALRVLPVGGATDADDTIVGELWDGPGRGLEPVAWSPMAGDDRLLVMHERRDQPRPLLWNLRTGEVTEVDVDLPGEVSVSWYPDATALLVIHDHHGRNDLWRVALDGPSPRLRPITTPAGAIAGAAVRPDGEVWYHWSDAAHPWQVRVAVPEVLVPDRSADEPSARPDPDGVEPVGLGSSDRVLVEPAGERAPLGVPCRTVFVDGPGGPVHAFLFEPPTPGAGPRPTFFDVHGGPEAHDVDAFHPRVQAWVDHGWAVVLVNYRGSDGYGKAWRDAIVGNPGLTELEDVVAVRDHLVDSGFADPQRLVLSGRSWGGYLTLLGLGTRPEAWSLGVAVVPVADYVAAFADEMEPLKAYDRALFGGTPDDIPEAYRLRSPITFVDEVAVPVLVVAGENDPRCPIRQIDNYLDALKAKGKPHEVYRYDAGHGSLVVEESIRQVEVVLEFLHRHHGSPAPL
jgi:acetyl esterase/lipase